MQTFFTGIACATAGGMTGSLEARFPILTGAASQAKQEYVLGQTPDMRGKGNMEINEKYYVGFEGCPEMAFCLRENDIIVGKIIIWEGYFDSIMSLVQPEEEGWTGLAYFYHLYIGWYEEKNWAIPNLAEAYRQLKNLNPSDLPYVEGGEVLTLICSMLKRAIEHNGKVYIDYF